MKKGKKRNEWHKNNIQLVFNYCKGKCHYCEIITKHKVEGAIHHTTYKPINGISVYDLDYKELLNKGIIQWVCKACHRKIHETISIDGITKIRGKCYVCNKRYGHTERSKLIDIDKPLCKICFKDIKKKRKMRENGQSFLSFD